MKYPNRVRELREDDRLSQRELAKRVDISAAEVHKIEVGNRKLKQEHIDKFCRFFGVTSDELLGRQPAEPAKRRPQASRIIASLDRIERLLVDIHEAVKVRP